MSSSDETKAEDLLDRLILEIKAVTLLYGSESELKSKLEDRVTGSHDEDVQKFVKAVQVGKQKKTGRLVAIALGELVLASVLVVAGAVVLVPTVVGEKTLSSLVQYFAQRVSGSLASSPLSPYLSFMEFVLGLALVLSALFALREAASNLKEAGLAVKPGEL